MEHIALQSRLDQQVLTRSTQVLMGICSGLVADGNLNDMETSFLSTWLAEHSDAAHIWPGDAVAARIRSILSDGVITSDERDDLIKLLSTLCGNEFAETGSVTVSAPGVPYDDIPIAFAERGFCLTGTFFFGTRAKCEKTIAELGGRVSSSVTGALDYLVVGGGCTASWVNETYGRKIEAAIERKKRYGQPAIISEQAWTQALRNHATS